MGVMDFVFSPSCVLGHSCSAVPLPGLGDYRALDAARALQHAPGGQPSAPSLPWLQQLVLPLTASPSCSLFPLYVSAFSAGSRSPAWEPSLGCALA